jgi:amidohydrolase
VTGALTLPEAGSQVDDEELSAILGTFLSVHGPKLVEVRRHIHAHPELSGHEFATAEFVRRQLVGAGLNPRLLPKGNGVICDIGTGGPVIALRADLDALPLPDVKNVPYASTVPGVCHACGHDVHTSVLLGAGLALAELERAGRLKGRVRLLFQPMEEQIPSGAPEVIAAGGLDDVELIYALHCAPYLEVGTVGVRSGPITASVDKIEIHLSGRGGHTARPHLTSDLVNALGRVVVDTPALLGRRTDPRSGASLVFGAVHAGEAMNTIPIEGMARGTVRVLAHDTWLELPDLVKSLVNDVVAGTGVSAEIDYVRGMPPVINSPRATKIIAGAAAVVLGEQNVLEAELSMGAEDFAFYLEQVPGSMVRLGVRGRQETESRDIHQSNFDVDEGAIAVGVRVFVHTALAALAAHE